MSNDDYRNHDKKDKKDDGFYFKCWKIYDSKRDEYYYKCYKKSVKKCCDDKKKYDEY